MKTKLVTIFNKDDVGLYEFRRKVCVEYGVDDFFLENSVKKTNLQDLLNNKCSLESQEEIYKVSKNKWDTQSFHSIECVLVEEKIVSISACETFGGSYLRVGMNLYTLRQMRSQVRDIMFSRDGFFSRHLETAKALGSIGVFLSVYEHTDKLRKHALNLSDRHRAVSPLVYRPYIDKLSNLGTFNVKGVQQTVIVYQDDKCTDWSDLVAKLKDSL